MREMGLHSLANALRASFTCLNGFSLFVSPLGHSHMLVAMPFLSLVLLVVLMGQKENLASGGAHMHSWASPSAYPPHPLSLLFISVEILAPLSRLKINFLTGGRKKITMSVQSHPVQNCVGYSEKNRIYLGPPAAGPGPSFLALSPTPCLGTHSAIVQSGVRNQSNAKKEEGQRDFIDSERTRI